MVFKIAKKKASSLAMDTISGMTMELGWLISSGPAPSMLVSHFTKYVSSKLNLGT